MYKTFVVSLLSVVLLAGCVNSAQVRDKNRQRIVKLSTGMTTEQVYQTMGTRDILVAGVGKVPNPYSKVSYQAAGHKIMRLSYYTSMNKTDGTITQDELTPLVIIDGKLAGTGWGYWKDVVKKYRIKEKK